MRATEDTWRTCASFYFEGFKGLVLMSLDRLQWIQVSAESA